MKLATAARLSNMYPDRHLNIFVPYETHDLDYNVTRALICTLKWSDSSLVRKFLSQLVNAKLQPEAEVLYDLQACDYEDFDPESCKTKRMLGISRLGKIASGLPAVDSFYQPGVLDMLRGFQFDPSAQLNSIRELSKNNELGFDELEVLLHTLEEYEQGSMPDGWVFSADGEVCVLIEAKLTRLLDRHQLDRHSETWFGEAATGDSLVLLTWEDIAKFADENSKANDAKTAFLCRQLFEYLEILGTAPFESFKPFDFDSDALHLGLPKVFNLGQELVKMAFDQGLPLSSKPVLAGMSVHFPWSDPSLLGSVGLELSDDTLSFVFSIGHHVGTNVLTGPHGVDRLLENCDRGLVNPLASVELRGSGYKAKVDRFVYKSGRPIFDRNTLDMEFSTASFGEVLEDLALQHPVPEQRIEQQRSAVLTISESLVGEQTLCQRDVLLTHVLNAFTDFAKVAKALSSDIVTSSEVSD